MKLREERIEHIHKVNKTANEDNTITNTYQIKNWRKKPLYRKIMQIDSEYLMFRTENSRTEIQQLAYIRKHSLNNNFFGDPESVRAQEAQEAILIEMVKSKGVDLLKDLKMRKQEDPCIITFDGYIVNGNRRTAALKYLGDRYIDCVVLPEDATPKDIYILEQQLQITKDFREEYHWINELRNIRKGTEDKRIQLRDDELAENLRLDLKEIRTKMRTLDLIDAFLEWKNISKQYDYPKLDDTEEIFRQLEKGIKKYSKDGNKLSELQNAIFNLIEERPTEGRFYAYVMDAIKNFDKIYSKMQTQNSVKKPLNNTESKKNHLNKKNKNILDELLEGEETFDTLFDKSENAAEISHNIIEIIKDVKAENKEKQDAEAVYEAVSAALRQLQGLIIDNDTAKIKSIGKKIEEIITTSEKLLKEINSIEN